MSLQNNIRKAFKKSRVIREASKWDPDTYPNIYELENFLRKSGYRLVDLLHQKGKSVPEVVIEPTKSGYLYPEISHDLTDGHFYINVPHYGLLGISEVEGVIQGYENALAVVRHLENLDLNKLEIAD